MNVRAVDVRWILLCASLGLVVPFADGDGLSSAPDGLLVGLICGVFFAILWRIVGPASRHAEEEFRQSWKADPSREITGAVVRGTLILAALLFVCVYFGLKYGELALFVGVWFLGSACVVIGTVLYDAWVLRQIPRDGR